MKVIHYLDRLEDRIRGRLSRYPIIYTLIGGIAIVVFWRGVWITTDQLASLLPPSFYWLDGILSVTASVLVLLATGLFVSFFINDQIILSGVKREKKLAERTETEVREERDILVIVLEKITKIEDDLNHLKQTIHKP
jgi:hypothetical protein